jgi:hypothetical protein
MRVIAIFSIATFVALAAHAAENACRERPFAFCSRKVQDIAGTTTLFNPKILFHGGFHSVGAAAPSPFRIRPRHEVFQITRQAARNLCQFFGLGQPVDDYEELMNAVSDNLFGWIRVVDLVPAEDRFTARWSSESFHFYKVVCGPAGKI